MRLPEVYDDVDDGEGGCEEGVGSNTDQPHHHSTVPVTHFQIHQSIPISLHSLHSNPGLFHAYM